MMLGRKQNIRNDEWVSAMEDIESLIPKKKLDAKEKATIKEIKAVTKGKKCAYSWSGGKDSIVLGNICERSDIKPCVLVLSDLEYPAFVQWVEENKPEELEIVNTGQDLDWLAGHPEMLFPVDSRIAARWFHIVQHRGQEKYYKTHGLDMLLLGRRKADGNYVGKGGNVYSTKSGVTRYSPLADWTHEEILAYIHYHNLSVPPIYEWKNGYLCGTHPWPARQWTGSAENGWAEVYDIDPSIVKAASGKIPGAEEFLKNI